MSQRGFIIHWDWKLTHWISELYNVIFHFHFFNWCYIYIQYVELWYDFVALDASQCQVWQKSSLKNSICQNSKQTERIKHSHKKIIKRTEHFWKTEQMNPIHFYTDSRWTKPVYESSNKSEEESVSWLDKSQKTSCKEKSIRNMQNIGVL